MRLDLAIAVLLLAGAAASADGAAARCVAPGRVVSAGTGLTLYAARDAANDLTRYAVCIRGARRPRRIGDAEGESGVQSPSARGRYLAYEYLACDDDTGGCTGGVYRFDARAPKRERKLATMPNEVGAATSLEVTARGAVALIRFANRRQEVLLYDAAGERLLAAGPAVDPRSLAVAGERIYWTESGAPRTAMAAR
jgi:hypothetical protein